MRLLQHKTEAYWFYRFLSVVYDRWVNPLFWTETMRSEALAAAALDDRGLRTLDCGAGTGFTTEGIVAQVDARNVTMIDQSPHQLARARAKPALAAVEKLEGDAEALPFGDDEFDRYVSAGSIEYWPDPQRGIAEAYRVLRAGGRATVIGPVRPANRLLRTLAQTWMLFPAEAEYRAWMERAGFAEVALVPLAPAWYRSRRVPYAVAAVGVKPAAGASPAAGAASAAERARAPMTPRRRLQFAARFAAGSLAGALFVPVGAVLHARQRLQERRGT
ncbi:MAG TPA: methyltransferase domain-containing protein [Solirubrobacteraceae bacterium]|nr:methyltransferase domain-containing protein [Solirubrobacteraceae bacterium]